MGCTLRHFNVLPLAGIMSFQIKLICSPFLYPSLFLFKVKDLDMSKTFLLMSKNVMFVQLLGPSAQENKIHQE